MHNMVLRALTTYSLFDVTSPEKVDNFISLALQGHYN